MYDELTKENILKNSDIFDKWIDSQITKSNVSMLINEDIQYFNEKLNIINIRHEDYRNRVLKVINDSTISNPETIINLIELGLQVELVKETAKVKKQIELLETITAVYRSV